MSKTEQFFHFNSIYKIPRYTVYTKFLQLDPKDLLLKILSFKETNKVKLLVGLSKVNPKDQYNRSIGRNISKSRAVEEVFTVSKVRLYDSKALVILVNDNYDLTFKMGGKFDNLHLIDVHARI